MRRLVPFCIPLLAGTAAAAPLADPVEQRLLDHIDANQAEALRFLEHVVNINSGTLNLAGVREVGRDGRTPLHARAQFELGRVHAARSEYAEAVPLLEDAYHIALAAGDDMLALQAAIEVATWVEHRDGDTVAAHLWVRQADTLVARLQLEDHPEVPLLLGIRAQLALQRGDVDEGLEAVERSLEIANGWLGTVSTERNIAIVDPAAIHHCAGGIEHGNFRSDRGACLLDQLPLVIADPFEAVAKLLHMLANCGVGIGGNGIDQPELRPAREP